MDDVKRFSACQKHSLKSHCFAKQRLIPKAVDFSLVQFKGNGCTLRGGNSFKIDLPPLWKRVFSKMKKKAKKVLLGSK